jgi:hypothetical protein
VSPAFEASDLEKMKGGSWRSKEVDVESVHLGPHLIRHQSRKTRREEGGDKRKEEILWVEE